MIEFFTGTMLIFSIIINIAVYIVNAIALYSIAQRNGVKNPWVAFIPIVQYYIIGSICEEYKLLGFRIPRLDILLCAVFLLKLLAAPFNSLLMRMSSMLLTILIALILHKFFYLFIPKKALIFAVLSLLGSLPMAVIFFLIKDIPMQMSAGAYPYPFPDKLK